MGPGEEKDGDMDLDGSSPPDSSLGKEREGVWVSNLGIEAPPATPDESRGSRNPVGVLRLTSTSTISHTVSKQIGLNNRHKPHINKISFYRYSLIIGLTTPRTQINEGESGQLSPRRQ